MKNRGKKEVEASSNYYNYNHNYNDGYEEGFVEFPCKKHPAASSTTSSRGGGICAFCLTDRLYQLVCPQCGEQRLSSSSSCSCSIAAAADVGRISFLLENDKPDYHNKYIAADHVSRAKPKIDHRQHRSSSAHVDEYAYPTLRRSNSSCVGYMNNPSLPTTTVAAAVDRKELVKDKFWKIGRLFRKKRDKHNNNNNNNHHDDEAPVVENMMNNECNNGGPNGVSRSRSLCNFRGFYDEEGSGNNHNNNFNVSITPAAARASTGNFYADSSAKMSCFSESEARFSNFDYIDANQFNKQNNNNNNNNNSYSSLRESEFMSCDDPAYIDLKLENMSSSTLSDNRRHSNSSSRVPPDLAAMRRSGLGMSTKEFSSYRGLGHPADHQQQDLFRSASCRRRSSVTERELRKCRKSTKVWSWFFKHQSSNDQNNHAFDS